MLVDAQFKISMFLTVIILQCVLNDFYMNYANFNEDGTSKIKFNSCTLCEFNSNVCLYVILEVLFFS